MNKIGIALAFLLSLSVQAAHAETSRGTIIVYQLTNNEFVVAADSRAVYFNKPSEDTSCKITAFDRKFVFATSAALEYVPHPSITGPDPELGWDNLEEARKALRRRAIGRNGSADKVINDVANLWAESVRADWQHLSITHPDLLPQAAKVGRRMITTAIFAGVFNGKLAFATREIRLTNGVPQIVVRNIDCSLGLCATGITDTAARYAQLQTASSA